MFARTGAAEAAKCIPHSNARVRSCEGERQSKTRRLSEWMARSACGGAAGSVALVSVSRGDASDRRQGLAGAGERPRGSDDPGGCAKAGVFFDAPGIHRSQER